MNRRVAFPFLTLSDSAVDAETWSLSLNGSEWHAVNDFLPDWDPSSIIRLRRRVRVDPIVATQDLSLDTSDLRLSIGVCLGTGQGRLPRLILLRECRMLELDTWEVEFEIETRGDELSSVLDIFTQITLASAPSTASPLSPQRFGDRLWADRVRIRLEGDEPRFPIEVADISTMLGDTAAVLAPWYLHWSPGDWSRDFHGAMRLYLNSARADFIAKFENEDPYILQLLMADVMGQVCERLIMDPEASEIFSEPEPGSLGAEASSWLRKAWPDKDLGYMKSLLENRPGKFRAAFLTLAELGTE